MIAVAPGERRLALEFGVDSLTPSERRIARMAAEGLTNTEVAQALCVTRKTVESISGAPTASATSRPAGKLAEALAR